jgi:hypothetical protein
VSFLSGGEGGDRPHIAVAECLSANLIKTRRHISVLVALIFVTSTPL